MLVTAYAHICTMEQEMNSENNIFTNVTLKKFAEYVSELAISLTREDSED